MNLRLSWQNPKVLSTRLGQSRRRLTQAEVMNELAGLEQSVMDASQATSTPDKATHKSHNYPNRVQPPPAFLVAIVSRLPFLETLFPSIQHHAALAALSDRAGIESGGELQPSVFLSSLRWTKTYRDEWQMLVVQPNDKS